ncbi:hypothetical protein ACG74X_10155 [Marivita sp. S0852]|uniref:hypothetical protein n=1 Tax=Marivita sp. S0852 TaxID=3373893 RepID=UPI0039826D16
MSENDLSFGPYRVSYAYRHHGDVPGEMGDFYKDAGKAKTAFTVSHNAQIVPNVPERFQSRAQGRGSSGVPISPHPSYAEPHKQAPDEGWFQVLAPELSDRALSRTEFKALRKKQDIQRLKAQSRSRY